MEETGIRKPIMKGIQLGPQSMDEGQGSCVANLTRPGAQTKVDQVESPSKMGKVKLDGL